MPRWGAALGSAACMAVGVLVSCSPPALPAESPPATPSAAPTASLFATVPARAPDAAFCAPGQEPRFLYGFAALKLQLGELMGDATECEHVDPDSGDTHQRTTTGLAYYRKTTNAPSFTNGSNHWALLGSGLVHWTDDSVDPPASAIPRPEE